MKGKANNQGSNELLTWKAYIPVCIRFFVDEPTLLFGDSEKDANSWSPFFKGSLPSLTELDVVPSLRLFFFSPDRVNPNKVFQDGDWDGCLNISYKR